MTTSQLPPQPPHGGFVFFSPAQFTWLAEALEYTMSQLTDLAARVTEFDSKIDALIAAYTALKNNPATTLAPEDAAALGAAMSGLTTEEASVDTANPPAPAPPVAPPAPAA